MEKTSLALILLFCFLMGATATAQVRIAKITGDVKIRRGLEEVWQPTAAGTLLEEIDSILTGEASQAVLELPDGRSFLLPANAILDVSDLRRITERELFLLLMSRKIRSLPTSEKTRLKIGRINVVHGEEKTDSLQSLPPARRNGEWRLLKNGATALFHNHLTTNAILKFSNILETYPEEQDCGEIHFFLGKSFEKLNKPGEALEAYQTVLRRGLDEPCSGQQPWIQEAEKAIKRLGPPQR